MALSRLAQLASRYPKRILLLSFLLLLVVGFFGAPAFGKFNAPNPFQAPHSSSAQAQNLLESAAGGETTPGIIAVVKAPPGSPAVGQVAGSIRQVAGVLAVQAPPVRGASPLVGVGRRYSAVTATVRSGYDTNAVSQAVTAALAGRKDVVLGGVDVANQQADVQASKDLGLAELLAFPILAVLALLIFRGVAALLPLLVGAGSIMGTFAALRLVNLALPLSSFALDLVIGLGLGLAVDYSLFLVWRFRENLASGLDVPAALDAALRRTGRTVLYSAVTVAAAMGTLCVFSERFLVSMGLGGAIVALISAGVALLVLPSMLVVLGRRVGKQQPSGERGPWFRLARLVMGRPVLFALAAVALLAIVASPAPRARWSGIDAAVLPASDSARPAQTLIDRDFPGLHGGAVTTVVASAPVGEEAALDAYASSLRRLPGVSAVQPPQRVGTDTWAINVTGGPSAISPAAQRMVSAIEARPAPVPVFFGGAAAQFHDQRTSIASRIPLALTLLALVTVAALCSLTGSIVLAIKSLLMNALTAAATMGVLVFVYQDGRFTHLLGYTAQGGVEETNFLVLASIAFALSTDYGVFLLARIKEARDGGLGNREAVAVGLARTGRLVTSAALLMAVAIGAFLTSKLVFLQEIGLGAVAAVLLDAFVVRGVLVPALMALLGRWNWWSPAPLARLRRRLALTE